jgi:hypothetical protein
VATQHRLRLPGSVLLAVLEHPAAATAQRQRQKEEAEPEPLRPHERQSQKVMAKKKAVAAAASSEEAERIPSKKEIADGKRYAELEATTSKNKLKQMTCFGFAKGRCKKGDDCPFLHVGAPNKLANAGKRKRVAAREEQGAKRKAAPKQKTWLCPKCGNKNWMRREVCNGHACQDQFRPSELKSGGTDPGRAETTTPHAAVVAGGVTTGGGRRLFLRKLAYDINEDKLRDFFKTCGEVKDVHWLNDKRNGQINAGFIEFADEDGARKGLAMSGKPCCGRPIRIEYAKAASEENPAAADAANDPDEKGHAAASVDGAGESSGSDSSGDSDDSDDEANEEWSSDSDNED